MAKKAFSYCTTLASHVTWSSKKMPSGEFRASRLGLHLHKGKPVFSSYSIFFVRKYLLEITRKFGKGQTLLQFKCNSHVCLKPAMSFYLCKLALSAFCWNVVFINIGQWTSWEARINTINNQRWYLSKNLRDRKFGPLKFTQKKRKSRQKRIRDKIA